MKKDYKFSIIVPIYNVGKYLEETIMSVVNQTIGFENIQLILINDGSIDNSEEICLKYQKIYPENIIYYKQKNSGVSAARNKGLELATGELVNFFDGDDIWDKHAFKEVYKNYKRNKDVQIYSCKLLFFDAKKGNHPLNYKYFKNKILNVYDDYNYPQLSISSVFFCLDLIKKYEFPKGIKYSEDTRLINEILLDEPKIMMLKKPKYYYRKRKDSSSAIQKQTQDVDWYFSTPINVYKYLFDLSEQKYNKVFKFIQYTILYDINWRLKLDNTVSPLNNFERKKYSESLIYLIKKMDDDIIINHRHLGLNEKLFVLKLKYGKNTKNMIKFEFNKLIIDDKQFDINQLSLIQIDRICLDNKVLKFYGKFNLKFFNKDDFKVTLNGKNIKINFYELAVNLNVESFDGEEIYDYLGVEFNVPINDENWILSFEIKNNSIHPAFKIGAIFSEYLPRSYHHFNKRTLVLKKGCIYNIRKRFYRTFIYELFNDINLFLKKEFKSLLIRLYTKISRIFKKKEIWFISDRIDRADDNGEHFFNYMVKKHPEKNIYFVLSSASVDYERLKKVGKVIDPRSIKYKFLFNIVDVVASAHGENYIFNPLGRKGCFVRDQYYFEYIFLQHGIIKDDLSPWLNINSKRIDMFVTSCNDEYNSVINGKYGYDKKVVKLTGLPRYDNLLKLQKKIKAKNSVMLSLTWRNALSIGVDKKTGKRLYNPNFKKSDYFKFINALINDERLLKVLENKKYKIRFIPHPNVMTQINDFNLNDFIEIEDGNINYQKEFCENKLLITDYSSVFFDFGYLEKPVIYYQSDRDDFYKGQVYQKGYFDYDTMGFGPCYTEYDKFINGLIKIIENDCKIEKKYLNRIHKTFKFHDTKNCERVYNEIEKLEK